MKRLFFTLIYFLFITPFGMITRLFGVKYLKKGFDSKNLTYWNQSINDKEENKKENYLKQY